MLAYVLLASLGFGGLYAETVLAHTDLPARALASGALAFILLATGLLVPPRLWRYTLNDVAPRVMSQVIARAAVASALVLVADIVVALLVPRVDVALVEELYVYSLLAILLFHGFGGAVASHVVYLQQTRQYNSNQLVAVLVLVTLLLLVLILYFFAFDVAIARDAHVHIRNLIAVTLVLLGYGRAVYLMAHH